MGKESELILRTKVEGVNEVDRLNGAILEHQDLIERAKSSELNQIKDYYAL
jgi:hypothetical protein